MQSKSQQIGLISNLLDQVSGLDTETKDRIDLEAEIDPELSVSENWEGSRINTESSQRVN